MRANPLQITLAACVASCLLGLLDFASAETQDAASLDPRTVSQILDDAAMARDAFSDRSTTTIRGQARIEGDWQTPFRTAKFSQAQIDQIASTGFYAALYKDAYGNVTIAYRATTGLSELRGTDVPANFGETPAQYSYAKQLAALVRTQYTGVTITATGHSLGGGLATYAAQEVSGIANVVTFNGARASILSAATRSSVNQINIIVSGDLVGDPKAGNLFGLGALPGKTYRVVSTTDTEQSELSKLGGWKPQDSHSLNGIIGGLQAVAGPAVRTPAQGASAEPKTIPTVTIKEDNASTPSSKTSVPAAQSSGRGRDTQASAPTSSVSPSRVASIQTAPAAAYIPPQSTFPAARPGGISLSRAAAERMPLNFSLEGASVDNGRIVLSGHSSNESSIDAALFLTALRATCEGRDPYFSLDPDDVTLWLKETEKGGEEFFEHIKKDTAWSLQKRATRNSPSILDFRTISASQSYPSYWSSVLAKYPHLRSRLVFGPEWLRQTRFGEILYKADVLLKELAGGVSMLGAAQMRASRIDDYLSATQISSAKKLLYKYHNLPDGKATVAGGRIWYDLSETSEVTAERPEALPAVSSELHTLLQKRHLLRDNPASAILPISLQQSAGSLDMSNVFPQMYVRVRDPITLRDGAGNFPGVNELVDQANRSPQKYAAAYKEYRALVEVFRAYIAAVHARRTEPRLCAKLPKDLLDAERLSVALPEYHPTDLALTIGWYEYSDGRFRRAIGATGALFQGGVSVGATPLFSRIAANSSDTALLRELKMESAKPRQEPTWAGDSGRQFVAFILDDVTASIPPARPLGVSLKAGEDFGPPVVPLAPRPAAPTKDNKPKEQRSAQWEQRLGEKVAQALPSVSAGPRRDMKPEEVAIPAVFVVVLLAILVRLLAGSSSAQTSPRASQGKVPQQPVVFAMPDLSSPDSVPYVPPWQRDSHWRARTTGSSRPQGAAASTPMAHAHDAVERDFKNVFAIKGQVDKEQMIRSWRNIHGGSGEDAMRRLVEQWRHDNR